MSKIIRRALKILESRMTYEIDLFSNPQDTKDYYRLRLGDREVVKLSLQLNAAAIICVHDHPSGICEPSHADELITKRIKEACALLDIRLLDHLIVSTKDVVSFAERGLI